MFHLTLSHSRYLYVAQSFVPISSSNQHQFLASLSPQTSHLLPLCIECPLQECPGFRCPPDKIFCFCHRFLYNQPGFINVKLHLETVCEDHGLQVIFLPKFHCELNFIEMCWGFAKWVYQQFKLYLKEDDLEWNVIAACESVPLAHTVQCAGELLHFALLFIGNLSLSSDIDVYWSTRFTICSQCLSKGPEQYTSSLGCQKISRTLNSST